MDTTEAIDAAAMKLGFRSLKLEQREAIHNFMDGKDVCNGCFANWFW